MAQIILNHIDIEIWNKRHVQFQPHSDVNIIMGINGSGKTTFLKNLYQSLSDDKERKEHIIYLPSIDNIAMRDKRKTATALSQDLDYYIRHEDRSLAHEFPYVYDRQHRGETDGDEGQDG